MLDSPDPLLRRVEVDSDDEPEGMSMTSVVSAT